MSAKQDNSHALYLHDLGDIIKTRALEVRSEREKHRGQEDEIYWVGSLIAFNEVISIMQQQAEGFGISQSEMRLDGIVPDRDLV